MNTSTMMDVAIIQRCIFDTNISMDISSMINVLIMQLGTSCSFDSPGLARDEPTLGGYLQGDSTP